MPTCLLNVVSFGSSYRKLWKESKACTNDNMFEAKKETATYRADLGGTYILDALTVVLEAKMLGDQMRRNVFVITDGQVSNTQEVKALAAKYNKAGGNIQIMSFGIGQ